MLRTPEQAEQLASLYVAGAMPADEAVEFEQLLRRCDNCRAAVRALGDVAEQLLGEIPPVVGDRDRRRALFDRVEASADDGPQVWKQWEDPADAGDLVVHRGTETVWEEIGIEGIRVQRLFVDRARDQITMRIQMDPGTAYPPHVHGGPEECFVVKGELIVDDMVLCAGDYQRCGEGSRHPLQRTETGCELLIVSSMSDELEH